MDKAKEVLERRRKERARLATYIYSSAQNMAKVANCSIQGQTTNRKENATVMRHGLKDFLIPNATKKLDNGFPYPAGASLHGKLSTIVDKSLVELCHLGQKHNSCETHDSDFLKEVLQERLQNEAATSRLIVEVTDLKSRLAECQCKQSETNFAPPIGCPLGGGDDSVNSIINNPNKSCISHDQTKVHIEAKVEERSVCCQKTVDTEFKENMNNNLIVDMGLQSALKEDCGKRTNEVVNASAKVLAWEITWRSEPKSYLAQKRGKTHNLLAANTEDTCLSKRTMLAPRSISDHVTLIQNAQNNVQRASDEERKLDGVTTPKRIELCKMRPPVGSIPDLGRGCDLSDGPVLACKDRVKSLLFPPGSSPMQGSGPRAPNRFVLEQVPNSSLLGRCREKLIISCLRNRKRNDSKRFVLSIEEKSLLASIERLDVKLATVFAKSTNSSQASLVSEGYYSTKSAPPIVKREPESDSTSVNISLSPLRPSASQSRFSIASRRRQIVGITNAVKQREPQTCGIQITGTYPMESRGELKDGTIHMHQNAEFLFS